MNILPHKSWHVRTKKNIERVRRDEEKAAEEEKEKQRKIALAEQEARTDFLRARSRNKAVTDEGKNNSVTDGSQISVSEDKQKPAVSQDLFPVTLGGSDMSIPGLGDRREHMNFFKDIEDGVVKQGKNKEYEEEKKKEQEELEKKIGLLTYLGQSSLGGQESAPWYLQKSKNKQDSKLDNDEDLEKKLKLSMEEKRKHFLDPLMQMKEFVDKKKHKHSKKKHKDKEMKIMVREKSRSTSSSSKSSTMVSSSSSSNKTIEQLRAERLARERQENIRTRALLTKDAKETVVNKRKAKDSSSEEEETEEETRGAKRKYNSQYNPDFVRQPKSRYRENFH